MNNKMILIATSTFGMEGVVANEIEVNGFEKITTENGRVVFTGDFEDIARSNICLRCADRILISVGKFEARTFDELFDKTKQLPWEEWIPKNGEFPVDGRSSQSDLFSISDCQSIVKKAIVERLKTVYHTEWFTEDGPRYKIEVAMSKNVATLTIDTSGTGLHKRGYRPEVSGAPIRETLAAGIINISRWKPERPFLDFCCGSGTLPIEAAMKAANIMPGIKRTFDCEKWTQFDKNIFKNLREKSIAEEISKPDVHIIGTDIDANILKQARRNAELAGVADIIHFQQMDLADSKSRFEYGTVICNPPYGERIGSEKEAEKLYSIMGKVIKKEYATWSFNIITPSAKLEQLIGKKANKKRKLYNGKIRCDLYEFFGPSKRKEQPHENNKQ